MDPALLSHLYLGPSLRQLFTKYCLEKSFVIFSELIAIDFICTKRQLEYVFVFHTYENVTIAGVRLKMLTCADCYSGMFGQRCTESCGKCLGKEQCHHVNGTCLNGCDPGYQGLNFSEGRHYYYI